MHVEIKGLKNLYLFVNEKINRNNQGLQVLKQGTIYLTVDISSV